MTMTDNKRLDWALHAESYGFSVIRIKPGKKDPAHKWKLAQKAPTTRDTITEWWSGSSKYYNNPNYNIGVVCGQVSGGLIVVDVDQKPGQVGADTLEALQMAFEDLPETWEARTANMVFSNLVNRLATIWEITDHETREIIDNTTGEIITRQHVFDLIWPQYVRNVKAQKTNLEDEGVGQTLLWEKVDYILREDRFPIAAERAEQQRARDAGKDGIGSADATTNEPESTASTELAAPHTTSQEQVTDAITKDVNNGTLFDFESKGPSDFGPDEPPPQNWLVKEWISEDITAGIYGPGGAGKSYVMQQLCYALAAGGGETWCGIEVESDPVRSLMIMGEDDDGQVRRRHYNLAKGMGYLGKLQDLDGCQMVPAVNMDLRLGVVDQSTGEMHTTKFYKRLQDQLIYGKFRFLTLDTISDTFAGNENDRTQVNQFVKQCIGGLRKAVLEATGRPLNIMIVGHPPKGGAGYSGSTAWNAAVRARLEYQPDPDTPEVRRLSLPKSNYSAVNDTGVQVIMENGILVPLSRPGPIDARIIHERIVSLVREADKKDGRLLQDAPKHAHGLVPVAMARLTEEGLKASKVLSVLQEMITEAREGFGALRIQKLNTAKGQAAGFTINEGFKK